MRLTRRAQPEFNRSPRREMLIELKIAKQSFRRITICVLCAAVLIAGVIAFVSAANSATVKRLSSADAIFVFAGGAEYKARARKAAEIYSARRAAKIILTNDAEQSGWSAADERNLFYWELARRELIENAVPADAIEVLPAPVRGTRDEAVLLADVARARRLHSILLVTSDFHAARALWTVERVFKQRNLNQRIGVESAESGGNAATRFGETIKFCYYRLVY